MRFIQARLDVVIFWLALLCALIDFTTTMSVCIIIMGIGWAGWYASRESAVSVTASNHLPPRARLPALSDF